MVASAIGMSSGPSQFAFGSLGIFMIPLNEEFGWSRSEISLALTFFTFSLACTIPFIGVLVDRFGSRLILIPSIAMFAVLLAAVPSFAEHLWLFWLLFFLIGIFGSGANALPYLRCLSSWFDRRRGLAIGIAMGGSGMGFVYVPPTIQYFIAEYGWRAGYFFLAFVVAFVGLPAVWFLIRNSPSSDESLIEIEFSDLVRSKPEKEGINLFNLLKRPLLWVLFSIFFLLSFCLYGLLPHLFPMMRDLGMETTDAALVQATLGVSIVVSRILVGFLMDRYFAPYVAALCFAFAAIGIALLSTGVSDFSALIAVILIGFSMGAEMDMLAFLASRYFGIKNFGQVYGLLFISFLTGTSLGPFCYGLAYDFLNSYSWVLLANSSLVLMCGIATIFLPRYPNPTKTT